MPLILPSRRAADRFDEVLRGAAVDDPELARLAAMTHLLVRSGTELGERTSPRAGFRARLRDRLLAEPIPVTPPATAAETEGARATRGGRHRPAPRGDAGRSRLAPRRDADTPPRGRRKLAAAATAGAVALGGLGTAYAAQHALPGSALYPVKRGLENAQLAVTRGDQARGARLLDQAQTRTSELRSLLAAGTSPSSAELAAARETVSTVADTTRRGVDLLRAAYARDHDPRILAELAGQLAALRSQLTASLTTAPQSLRADIERLLRELPSVRPGRGGLAQLLLPGASGVRAGGLGGLLRSTPPGGVLPSLPALPGHLSGGGPAGAGGTRPSSSQPGVPGVPGPNRGATGSAPAPGQLPGLPLPLPLPTGNSLPVPTTVPPLPLPLPSIAVTLPPLPLPLPLPAPSSSVTVQLPVVTVVVPLPSVPGLPLP